MIDLLPFIRRTIAVTGSLFLLMQAGFAAESHIVSPAELHQRLTGQAAARRAQEARIQGFLATPGVAKTLRTAHIDAAQVSQAVSTLDDQEVAELAARVDSVNRDIAAGALSNEQITYILIALCTAVIVLILVH